MAMTTRSCWRDVDNDADKNDNGSFKSHDIIGAIYGNGDDDNYCDNNMRTMRVMTIRMMTEMSALNSDDSDGGKNNAVDVDNVM